MLGPRDGRVGAAVLPVQTTVTGTLRAHGLCLLYTGPLPLCPPRTPLQGQGPLGLGVRFQLKAALPSKNLQSGGGTNTQPPDSAVEVRAVPAELAQGGHLAWGPGGCAERGSLGRVETEQEGAQRWGVLGPQEPVGLGVQRPPPGSRSRTDGGRGQGRGAGGGAQSREGSLGLSLALHQQKSGLSPRDSPPAHHVLIHSPSVRGRRDPHAAASPHGGTSGATA